MKYLHLAGGNDHGALLEEFYCNFIKVCCSYGEKRHVKDIAMLGDGSNFNKTPRGNVAEMTTVILLLDDDNDDILIGGVVFDYYARVNQALIRCIVVKETSDRKEEFFKGLLDESFDSVTLFSKKAGNAHGVNHIFFESNEINLKECEDNFYKWEILHEYGFALLDIDHRSILCSTQPCRQLLVHCNSQGKYDICNTSINSQELVDFYKEYYSHNLDITVTNLEDRLPWFKQFHDHLTSLKNITVHGLLPLKVNRSTQVIVVGGGMAGLAASALLTQSHLDVVLVEASNYLGGRVKQVKPFDGWPPVDLGGEFIHGCETITYQLAMENNWEIEMLFDYNSEREAEWIYLDGKMYPYHSTHADIKAVHTVWGEFIYHGTQDDATKSSNEDDVSAAEYFKYHPELNAKISHIFNTIFCQTEAANLETYGCQEQGDFQDLWDCGPGNFRLKNSQEQLVKHYLKSCEKVDKMLNWQATEIDYTNGVVPESLRPFPVTVTNQNGEKITACAAIVCVPVTVLKDHDITFKPELPRDKLLAVERIQMHTGFKIICRFSHRFWPENVKLVFNCTSDISQLWMYTNVKEETGEQCHIVTGFQTAEYARQKAHLTADEIKQIFIKDLDEMFGNEDNQMPASKSIIDFVYYHWSSHPFVRGAYSSPSVNARGSREILARPLGNCVFFAGEATRSGGDSCTVSGAIESGLKAAQDVTGRL